MSTIIKTSDINKVIDESWESCWLGSANLNVKFIHKITLDESKQMQEHFIPSINECIEKLKKMSKNELNKHYRGQYINKLIKIPHMEHWKNVALIDVCSIKHVRGRRICDFMTMDDIFKQDLYGTYYSPKGSAELYKMFRLEQDGCYSYEIKDAVYQHGITQQYNKRFNRTYYKNLFKKSVKEYIKKCEENGWKLISTEHFDRYNQHIRELQFIRSSLCKENTNGTRVCFDGARIFFWE